MIKLYTIGFTGKSAEKFFRLLKQNSVTAIIDTRLNNTSQLSGFAKGSDLAFFANEIGNIRYAHRLDLAPSKELLQRYRSGAMTWNEYETGYLNLLDERKIARKISPEEMHNCCLLCSEHSPEKCHRRLLAEYLQHVHTGLQIVHLM
jgi:uncharacterized protein (DUF488 family)